MLIHFYIYKTVYIFFFFLQKIILSIRFTIKNLKKNKTKKIKINKILAIVAKRFHDIYTI